MRRPWWCSRCFPSGEAGGGRAMMAGRIDMITPSLEEFLKLAGQGNLIPVTSRILADIETPLSAYRKIRGQGESFLFESVEGGEHLGRYSFVGCNPRAVIKQTGNRIEVTEDGKVTQKFAIPASGKEPCEN